MTRLRDVFAGYSVRLQPVDGGCSLRIHDSSGSVAYSLFYRDAEGASQAAEEWLSWLGSESELRVPSTPNPHSDVMRLLRAAVAEYIRGGNELSVTPSRELRAWFEKQWDRD